MEDRILELETAIAIRDREPSEQFEQIRRQLGGRVPSNITSKQFLELHQSMIFWQQHDRWRQTHEDCSWAIPSPVRSSSSSAHYSIYEEETDDDDCDPIYDEETDDEDLNVCKPSNPYSQANDKNNECALLQPQRYGKKRNLDTTGEERRVLQCCYSNKMGS